LCFSLGASTILSIVYDLPPTVSSQDPLVVKIDEFNVDLVKAMYPGSYLVEIFPWMLHLPSVIAPWKKYHQNKFKKFSALFQGLYHDVGNKIV
jgi:hypothetical protein